MMIPNTSTIKIVMTNSNMKRNYESDVIIEKEDIVKCRPSCKNELQGGT